MGPLLFPFQIEDSAYGWMYTALYCLTFSFRERLGQDLAFYFLNRIDDMIIFGGPECAMNSGTGAAEPLALEKFPAARSEGLVVFGIYAKLELHILVVAVPAQRLSYIV